MSFVSWLRRGRTDQDGDHRVSSTRRAGQAALVLVVLVSLVLFLLPNGWDIHLVLVTVWGWLPPWVRERVSPDAFADFLNAVVFAVLIFLISVAFPRWRTLGLLLGAFLLSAGIETVQYLLLPGRDAQVRDVVMNTLGGGIGALCAWMFWNEILRWWRHRDLDRGVMPSGLGRNYSSSSPSR